MSFKFLKVGADRLMTYCDEAQHVLIKPPINAHAHENYGVEVIACDCIKPEEPVTE